MLAGTLSACRAGSSFSAALSHCVDPLETFGGGGAIQSCPHPVCQWDFSLPSQKRILHGLMGISVWLGGRVVRTLDL